MTRPAPGGLRVKICGLRDREGLEAAAAAAYVGFVHFPRSPRHLDWDGVAALAAQAPPGPCKVLLLVDPDDEAVDRAARLPVDMLQLHGRESPARVAAVRARAGLPVMKALGVGTAEDLAAVPGHAAAADQLLIDAKPAEGAAVPGGAGRAFDWGLLAGRRWTVPWMLAGGLTAATLPEAVRVSGARQADVSSGVESAPGVKDPALIAAFLAAAAAL